MSSSSSKGEDEIFHSLSVFRGIFDIPDILWGAKSIVIINPVLSCMSLIQKVIILDFVSS